MDRATAVRLHRKLRALAGDRAAAPGEKAVATQKADRLAAKFKISAHEGRTPRKRAPAYSYKGRRRRVWVVGDDIAPWSFNVNTGRGSDNVTVHSYQDRSNWKIEVDLTAGGAGRRRVPRGSSPGG